MSGNGSVSGLRAPDEESEAVVDGTTTGVSLQMPVNGVIGELDTQDGFQLLW